MSDLGPETIEGAAETSPRLKAPAGSCDAHIHFYDSRYPQAPTATRIRPDASISEYRRVQRRLGIKRFVMVHSGAYGRDNTFTVDQLKRLGGEDVRAVVALDSTGTETEISSLHDLGARGARFLLFAGGDSRWDQIEPVAAMVRPFGWHVQIQVNGHELPHHEAMLRRLPVPLVIDHIGRFQGSATLDSPAVRTLLRLMEAGHCWVKLSGPYLWSTEPGYRDVTPIARELVRRFPDRMLWGSDWPHASVRSGPQPDEANLLDLLLEWADDSDVRHRILVDNPARLYEFSRE